MQFEFKNPELITTDGIDKVRVTVLDQDYFGVNENKVINFDPIEISLPRQIADPKEAAAIEAT